MFLIERRGRVDSFSGSYMRVRIFRSRSGLGFVVVFTVFPSRCLDTVPKLATTSSLHTVYSLLFTRHPIFRSCWVSATDGIVQCTCLLVTGAYIADYESFSVGHIVVTNWHRWQLCVRNCAIWRLKVQPNLICYFIITEIGVSKEGKRNGRKKGILEAECWL